jgi:hypothetical protein
MVMTIASNRFSHGPPYSDSRPTLLVVCITTALSYLVPKLAGILISNPQTVWPLWPGCAILKELGRSYLTLTKDVTRVMNRIKALCRSWAIPCAGAGVYAPRHHAERLAKIVEPGVRVRAQRLYQQLDSLQPVRLAARRDLVLNIESMVEVSRGVH